MLAWIREFWKRHRRKFFITGAVITTVFAVGKYLKWKLEEWQEQEALQVIERAKKQQHFESNQRTCIMTFLSFLPTLRGSIVSRFETNALLQALRAGTVDKVATWEKIKIAVFASVLSSIYASCLLYMYLKVKINIIGGNLYLNMSKKLNQAESQYNTEDEERYLKNVHYFFDKGLPLLMEDVENFMIEKLKDITLREKFTHKQLGYLVLNLTKTFCGVESDGCYLRPNSVLAYLLNETSLDNETHNQGTSLENILRETADVLESGDCHNAFAESVIQVTEQHLEEVLSYFESDVSNSPGACKDDETTLPLAKLLPVINSQINQLFKAGKNSYLDAMFKVAATEEFAASVYDSFSTAR